MRVRLCAAGCRPLAAVGAADAVDTHVTYEILLSGGRDARGSGFGAAQRRAEVRVSSHLGARRRPAAPGCYTFGVRTCIDQRGIQVRLQMSIERIHIQGPNVYRPARDTGSGANEYQVDTNSGSECVSTCAGYSFVPERVASRYTFAAQTCIGESRDKPLATNRTSRRRVGCARPTAPKWPPGNRPSPHRADSPTARPPHTPQRLRAR